MASHFMITGDIVQITNTSNVNVQDRLPLGTYSVNYDDHRGVFFLRIVSSFDNENFKVYGEIKNQCKRILNTYHSRSGSTGALFLGRKGSGKSLLSKLISTESKLPVILVNSPFAGTKFAEFLGSIEQECIVLFDEFEKTYSKDEEQEALLTIFDGVFTRKKLFLLTANNKFKINEHFFNRPGRIYYKIEFKGMDEAAIREYLDEKLNNKDHYDSIIKVSSLVRDFNFDILKALVEENNRYNEPIKEAIKMLNLDVYDDNKNFSYIVKLKDKIVSPECYYLGMTSAYKPFTIHFYDQYQGDRSSRNAYIISNGIKRIEGFGDIESSPSSGDPDDYEENGFLHDDEDESPLQKLVNGNSQGEVPTNHSIIRDTKNNKYLIPTKVSFKTSDLLDAPLGKYVYKKGDLEITALEENSTFDVFDRLL